jgi:hypothetical protein
MVVLDTNVLSVMMRPQTAPRVMTWLDRQPIESIWTTSVTVFEIHFGLRSMGKGTRQRVLEERFERILRSGIGERVLAFDTAAAKAAVIVAGKLRIKGRVVEMRDLQIAGIVAARRGTLATRNTKHFADSGIPIINPWDQ